MLKNIKNILCCVLAAVVCAGCISIRAEKSSVAVRQECKKPAQMLRHVVLFRFKEGATPEQIKEVEDAFSSLPGKIDAIKCLEWGANVSIDERCDGFTHCFVLSFLSEADRDAYLIHPDHQKLREAFSPIVDKVLVLDYWPR
jgi:hypothetical protein